VKEISSGMEAGIFLQHPVSIYGNQLPPPIERLAIAVF
jgi:hypothetical protein